MDKNALIDKIINILLENGRFNWNAAYGWYKQDFVLFRVDLENANKEYIREKLRELLKNV